MHRIADFPSKKQLLTILWKNYSNQKKLEADSGLEVFGDIEKMRVVFRAILEGKDPNVEVLHDHKRETNPLQCEKCNDEGMYFSPGAYFRRHGPRGAPMVVQTRGYRICDCHQGLKKRDWLRSPWRPQKKEREEF